MLERLRRRNFNNRKEAIIKRIDFLFFSLEKNPVHRDRYSWGETRRRDIKDIGFRDFSFLNNGSDGSLYPRPRLLVEDRGEEVWIGVAVAQRRVRHKISDSMVSVAYEEKRGDTWVCLDERQSEDLGNFEKLVRLGEQLVNGSGAS